MEQPFGELDEPRRSAGKPRQQFVALDDFEIVEAEAVPGRRQEGILGLVMRRDQDGAVALFRRAIGGDVKLDFVHPLLVEQD